MVSGLIRSLSSFYWQKSNTTWQKEKGFFNYVIKRSGDIPASGMAWTRGSNNVFRIPSLSVSPFFSSIFLSRFFPVFHSNSSIVPAEEKESFFTFSIFPIRTPRFEFHWSGQVHIPKSSSERKYSEERHTGSTQTSWSESFPKKNWSAITPTERNGHRAEQSKR